MLKIGLTGGIGSGKSMVASLFELLGIPVYYADDRTKDLMNSDPLLRAAISREFGEASYKNGELDRSYLASLVFNDKEKLDRLNALTHPVTIRDAENWINRQTGAYVIKEAALLFESGANARLDKVIGVYAPEPLRIQRVMKRDQMPAEEIRKRISRQLDEEVKMKRCDFIITNNDQELVIPQVLALDKQFREMVNPGGFLPQ